MAKSSYHRKQEHKEKMRIIRARKERERRKAKATNNNI